MTYDNFFWHICEVEFGCVNQIHTLYQLNQRFSFHFGPMGLAYKDDMASASACPGRRCMAMCARDF